MRNLQLYVLVAVLMAAGLGMVAYRHVHFDTPLIPGASTSIWAIEARINVEPDPNLPIKLELMVPETPPAFSVIEETIINSGYGVNERELAENRSLVFTKRRSEDADILYYRARVVRVAEDVAAPQRPNPIPPQVPAYPAQYRSTVMEFLDGVRQDSADIVTFTALLLQRLVGSESGRQLRDLVEEDIRAGGLAGVAAHLLHGARIPARTILGFRLEPEARDYDPESLVQVHNGERWVAFDPETAETTSADDFFVWCVGTTRPLRSENVLAADVAFSVLHTAKPTAEIVTERLSAADSPIGWLSLTRLPVDLQKVYKVLLLLPVGALLVVVIRNVVGIPTAGTFSPVLLALAFRETHLLAGVALSTLVVAFGLAARLYLERLNLLFVPKISAVLISVILLMTLISLTSSEVGFADGISVSLFPIVVLAWIIERLSVVWEENGPQDALPQAVGTLVVASAAYLVINTELIKHLTFNFPEIMLILLGITLLFGRYTGYRLSELWRFRALRG